MSIKLEHDVVTALAHVPLAAVSRLQGELLRDFARHADTKSGLIFVSLATAARELRSSVRYTRVVVDGLIASGVLVVVTPSRQHRPRELRIDLEALRALQGAQPVATLTDRQHGQPQTTQEAGANALSVANPHVQSGQFVSPEGLISASSMRTLPGVAAPKGESKSKGSVKEESCSYRNNSSIAAAPLVAPFGGPGAAADVDLRQWRSCWEFITAVAGEMPAAHGAYDHIRARVVDEFPAVASDSRLGPAIRHAIEVIAH